jgi:hypothetical protein
LAFIIVQHVAIGTSSAPGQRGFSPGKMLGMHSTTAVDWIHPLLFFGCDLGMRASLQRCCYCFFSTQPEREPAAGGNPRFPLANRQQCSSKLDVW